VKLRRACHGALLAALLSGCTHAGAPLAAHAPPGDRPVSLDAYDRGLLSTEIYRETNRVRRANGFAPLRRLPELDEAADEQAMHMAMTLVAEHRNPIPGELTVADRVARTGLRMKKVEENPPGSPQRDYTYAGLASSIVQSWMDSPGHRLNLLDPDVTSIGCSARLAHELAADQRVFAIQVFLLPK
jgi:uncharacterized protein YkwD